MSLLHCNDISLYKVSITEHSIHYPYYVTYYVQQSPGIAGNYVLKISWIITKPGNAEISIR